MLVTSVFVLSVLLRRKKRTKMDIEVKDNLNLFVEHLSFIIMSLQLEKSSDRNFFKKISFNSERDILIGTTDNGYSIINCCPITPIISKNLCQHGFSYVDIYKRSNIILFSGTEKTVKYNANTLYVFDDSMDSEIARLVFDDVILSSHVKYNYIVVILKEYTFVYNLADLTLYSKYNTYANPKGIFALELRNNEPIIVTLGKIKGTIRISFGKKDEQIIRAHESAIGCLCVSKNGEFAATASVRGSVIRVFDTKTSQCISSIRRGHMYAVIVNMEFDRHTQYLLCNSDTTLHIAKRVDKNTKLSKEEKYRNEGLFSTSFVIRYPNPDRSKSMVAVFGSEPDSIYLVTSKGLFQKLSLDGERSLVVFQKMLLSECHLLRVC